MYKKRLTSGNKKVKALLFSMSPVSSCLNSSTCASSCYAMKAYKQYPNVRTLWDDNLSLARNNLFKLYDDLNKQLSKTKSNIVRIHQSGDFISQEYVNMWVDLARKYKDIYFYSYTKVDNILDLSILESLPNVRINKSMIKGKYRNYGSLSYVSNIIKHEGGTICPATYGANKDSIKCGVDCFKCITKEDNSNILFVEH